MLVLSLYKQSIYACMDSWLAHAPIVLNLLYVSFPNNLAPT